MKYDRTLIKMAKKNAPAVFEKYRSFKEQQIDVRLSELRVIYKHCESDDEKRRIVDEANNLKEYKEFLSIDAPPLFKE